MMGFKQTLPLVACLFSFLIPVTAQTDECSCAPAGYRFTFDFNATCTEYNSTDSLVSPFCDTEVWGDADTSDLKPVTVSSITVVELDENSVGIAQQNTTYTLNDGDSFEYISSIYDENSTFPSTIQLNIYGENAAGDSIVNVIAVSFTKNCSAYPVFEEDFSLGWVKLGELVPPPVGVCTAYDETVTAPPTSTIVSASPTMAPVIQVTSSPTVAPVIAADTTAPTAMPITAAPVPLPITTAPTLVMSLSMSMDIDLSMSMGTGYFDYSMLGMMGDLEDFGLPVPKGKDDKTVKAGTKKAKSGKKAKKSAKADASTKSSKKGGASVVQVTSSPTVAPVVAADTPTPVMSLSMSMDIDLSMSMGSGYFDYSMLGMMGDLEDFGLSVPKAKDDKTVKAGAKKAKSAKDAKKSAKADASTKSDKKGGAAHSESKEAKKGKDKEGERRRRLRLHQIVA